MWRLRDGSRRTLWHGFPAFTSVAFSPTGQYLAAGNENGFLNIWDVRTGRLLSRCKIEDHIPLSVRTLIFTPDGKTIASGSKTLKCWNVSSLTGSRSKRPEGDITRQLQLSQIWEFYGQTVRSSFMSSDLKAYLFHQKAINQRHLLVF
jgi:WD40 repeat protein